MIIESFEDVKNLIDNRISESTNIEYKDPRSLENSISIAKDISAMANSNGGTIIYGLCEENKDQTPTKIEWINNNKYKEKIEQVIQTRITPKIENIEINTVYNPTNEKEFVLVVNVKKSDIAPHQDIVDKDNRRYWRRNGFTTRQMEHYEIEDLFFKRKRPDLSFRLVESKKSSTPSFDLLIINRGKICGKNILVKLFLPKEFVVEQKDFLKLDLLQPSGGDYDIYQYTDKKTMFYPEIETHICRISCPKKKNLFHLLFRALVVCEDMESKFFKFIFDSNNAPNYISIYSQNKDDPFTSPSCHLL